MELTKVEQVILDRFAEKCRIAGGLRAGYMLREEAICYYKDESPELDFEQGLEQLVAKDLLKVNEGGGLYYLTAAGVAHLGG